jgi:MFS superfamily sulfate permease-like transporter
MTVESSPPVGNAAGFKKYFKSDLVSGLLVFLIALPLCLGISGASGFPAINGVFTAIAGGLICVFLSNSELTIKGPAAGMIAIVLGAVTDFALAAGITKDQMSNTDLSIYSQYLPSVAAVAVVAGALQILLGAIRAGALADMFPTAVIHGLLASIGLIIIGKQLYMLLGLKPNTSTEAYEAYFDLPAHIPHFAWQVAIIGFASLALLFAYPHLKKRFAICKIIPAQLIILVVAIPAAMYLYQAFDGSRTYEIMHEGHEAKQVVKTLLVKVPESASALPKSLIYPDFSKVNTFIFWKWVVMFCLVGSLESLLSAKAVDVLDPWKRKSDLNRDLLAVGVANTAVALIGGLPMISEIVRSSANKDFGAKTRWANFFHGLFLFLSIVLLPFLLNKIPLTALAAMLIYAGCRLAHYKEFLHMYHVGKEQLLIFLSTIIGVLATDLLIGVGIGIIVKIVCEMFLGVSPMQFFQLPVFMDEDGKSQRIALHGSATFTNWLMLKKKINNLPEGSDVVVDCSDARFIDHTVMSRLDEMRRDYEASGRSFTVVGLGDHKALSHDELAARRLPKKAK